MQLYIWNSDMSVQIPVHVLPACEEDLARTQDWQTQWTSAAASQMPNKVALHRTDDHELLGLMSYDLDENGLAVEIIYLESAGHSNANHIPGNEKKKYIGIARALFAYAISVSVAAGYDGVVYFKAKTSVLREYYIREFGAVPLGSYDPYRLIIWEDAAQRLLAEFE